MVGMVIACKAKHLIENINAAALQFTSDSLDEFVADINHRNGFPIPFEVEAEESAPDTIRDWRGE